jgi:hypothetical protein
VSIAMEIINHFSVVVTHVPLLIIYYLKCNSSVYSPYFALRTSSRLIQDSEEL